MRALLLVVVVLLAAPALAQDAGVPDAPIVFTVNPDGSRTVPPESWVRMGQRQAACAAERDAFRAAPPIPLWIPIVVGVVALGAGAVVGYAVHPSK